MNTITIFAFFIALWATLMLEYWKRERHHHVKEWGMSDFEALEVKRPQFINNPLVTKVPSPVTGLNMEYFDPKIKRRRVVVSWISIGTLIAIVLTAVFSIFVLRLWFVSLENDGTIPVGAAGNLAAAVNAVQIQVRGCSPRACGCGCGCASHAHSPCLSPQLLNLIYGRVARYLNKMENHATQTEFEDNLIAKTFCFQFINSYFSLFYIGTPTTPSPRVCVCTHGRGACVIGDVRQPSSRTTWSCSARSKSARSTLLARRTALTSCRRS